MVGGGGSRWHRRFGAVAGAGRKTRHCTVIADWEFGRLYLRNNIILHAWLLLFWLGIVSVFLFQSRQVVK
jgi:hypothetical protein